MPLSTDSSFATDSTGYEGRARSYKPDAPEVVKLSVANELTAFLRVWLMEALDMVARFPVQCRFRE